MFVDKDGEVFEHTYISPDGRTVVHHHGTKKLTGEQSERISEIISKAWDDLPEETKKKINKKMELKYGREGVS